MATKNKKFNPNDYEPITLMEPMLPDEANLDLEDLCVDLVAKSNALASKLDPNLKNSIADLVRSMNCYYSNLIEGHNTHPRDIEKALEGNLSKDPEKRNLQLEAKAHIYVQEAIDNNDCWGIQEFVSKAFISKIHEEFYKLLPEDLFTVVNIDTSEKTKIIPGKFRDAEVIVGRHIPPKAINLDSFMARFEEAYDIKKLSKLRQIIAVAASHHRLTWIHPFYDGNGRVARLFSHAFLKYIGIGSGLWSVSRALARNNFEYKKLLEAADQARQGDLDGRGSLSQKGLIDFCKFFIEACIDQIDYMSSILEPQLLLKRIEIFCEESIRLSDIPKGSFQVLRELVLRGEIARGEVAAITGYQNRQATSIIAALIKKGLLVSDSPKGSLRLGFPVYVLERFFPQLYPYDNL